MTEVISLPTEPDVAAFLTERPRLFGIAFRILGSTTDADDVVQDAWLRWQRTDRRTVRSAPAFLATATTRLAINAKQSARARHETQAGSWPFDLTGDADPARDAERREALELSMQVVLETLSDTERAVYLLREAFDYPYRQIAERLGIGEANARQLCTRARRRVAGGSWRTVPTGERRRLVDAFVAAGQTGELRELERVLATPLDPAGVPLGVAA